MMARSGGEMTNNVSSKVHRSIIRWLAVAAALVTVLSLVICVLVFSYRDNERIIRGVIFSPHHCPFRCDLSGMTPEQAREELLRSFWKHLEKSKIRLVARPVGGGSEQASWTFDARSIGIRFDVDEVVKAAYEYGRRGGFLQRLRERLQALRGGFIVTSKYALDETVARCLIRKLGQAAERPPKDAKVKLVGGRPRIVAGSHGIHLDRGEEEMTLRLWRAILGAGDFVSELPIFVSVVRPQVSTEDVAHIDAVIGKCTTYYSARKVARAHNIHLAASAIDGKLIREGEVFSFNEVVGPRCFERGYKIAPMLVRGRFEPGIGGGVCQVAGTLFNAALHAGLQIVERHRHSRPVDYLPAGMDATVDYGSLDLKLRNPYPYAVYIKAYAGGGRLTVLILGKQTEVRYRVRSKVVKVIPPPVVVKVDPSLPAGKRLVEQRGHSGYATVTWRSAYMDGKLLREEVICRDLYLPQPTIIRVGAPANPARAPNETIDAAVSQRVETASEASHRSHTNQHLHYPRQSSGEQLIDVRKLFFSDEE